MGKPAVIDRRSGKPVAGLPSDQQILAHLDWHKQAVMPADLSHVGVLRGCAHRADPKNG